MYMITPTAQFNYQSKGKLAILCLHISKYLLSMSKPMHETPNLMDANAVEPIPMNGSRTTLHLLTPCNLIHISGSLIGKVDG